MIITKEAQQRIVSEYSKEHTTREVLGFIDGIDATICLMIKIQMDQNSSRWFVKLKKCNPLLTGWSLLCKAFIKLLMNSLYT